MRGTTISHRGMGNLCCQTFLASASQKTPGSERGPKGLPFGAREHVAVRASRAPQHPTARPALPVGIAGGIGCLGPKGVLKALPFRAGEHVKRRARSVRRAVFFAFPSLESPPLNHALA